MLGVAGSSPDRARYSKPVFYVLTCQPNKSDLSRVDAESGHSKKYLKTRKIKII